MPEFDLVLNHSTMVVPSGAAFTSRSGRGRLVPRGRLGSEGREHAGA
jgi:hypothetical protein